MWRVGLSGNSYFSAHEEQTVRAPTEQTCTLISVSLKWVNQLQSIFTWCILTCYMAQGSQKDRAENLKYDTTSVPTQVKEITYKFNNKNMYPHEEWPYCNYRLFSSYVIWSTVNASSPSNFNRLWSWMTCNPVYSTLCNKLTKTWYNEAAHWIWN